MFKGLKPITYRGREVWPLIEGGKGVSASNHASSGAWAAAGGIGVIEQQIRFGLPERQHVGRRDRLRRVRPVAEPAGLPGARPALPRRRHRHPRRRPPISVFCKI